MHAVVCPECKKRSSVRSKPDLPQNNRTGVYCEFCKPCRDTIYRRLLYFRDEDQRRRQRERDATDEQREYQRRYNAKWRK